MTNEVREKLMFVAGMLEGIAWLVSDDGAMEAISNAREQIEEVLKEEKTREGKPCQF